MSKTKSKVLPSGKKSIFEPGIKVFSPRSNSFGLPHITKIMSCRSGTNNKHAFLLQRGQSFPHIIMMICILVCLNGELTHRNISFRVHEHEWDPCTMVKTPLLVLINLPKSWSLEKLLNPPCQFWSSRSRILDLDLQKYQNISMLEKYRRPYQIYPLHPTLKKQMGRLSFTRTPLLIKVV